MINTMAENGSDDAPSQVKIKISMKKTSTVWKVNEKVLTKVVPYKAHHINRPLKNQTLNSLFLEDCYGLALSGRERRNFTALEAS